MTRAHARARRHPGRRPARLGPRPRDLPHGARRRPARGTRLAGRAGRRGDHRRALGRQAPRRPERRAHGDRARGARRRARRLPAGVPRGHGRAQRPPGRRRATTRPSTGRRTSAAPARATCSCGCRAAARGRRRTRTPCAPTCRARRRRGDLPPGRRGAAARARALRVLRRLRAALGGRQRARRTARARACRALRALAPAAARRARPGLRGRGRPAAARPARRRWAATRRSWSCASSSRTSWRGGRGCARPPATCAAGDEEWLAAKVVGRWSDGTPVSLAPRAPQDAHDHRPARDQRLPLRRRPPGAALPGGRAHPPREPARGPRGRRGADAPPPDRPPRHALRPAASGDEDDGVERGLLFTCFNASIARQFEVVQDWCVDGNVFGLGPGDRDLLAGAAAAAPASPSRARRRCACPGPGARS